MPIGKKSVVAVHRLVSLGHSDVSLSCYSWDRSQSAEASREANASWSVDHLTIATRNPILISVPRGRGRRLRLAPSTTPARLTIDKGARVPRLEIDPESTEIVLSSFNAICLLGWVRLGSLFGILLGTEIGPCSVQDA